MKKPRLTDNGFTVMLGSLVAGFVLLVNLDNRYGWPWWIMMPLTAGLTVGFVFLVMRRQAAIRERTRDSAVFLARAEREHRARTCPATTGVPTDSKVCRHLDLLDPLNRGEHRCAVQAGAGPHVPHECQCGWRWLSADYRGTTS